MADDARTTREDRLKATLKTNMARRKAQKRTRAVRDDGPPDGTRETEAQRTEARSDDAPGTDGQENTIG